MPKYSDEQPRTQQPVGAEEVFLPPRKILKPDKTQVNIARLKLRAMREARLVSEKTGADMQYVYNAIIKEIGL